MFRMMCKSLTELVSLFEKCSEHPENCDICVTGVESWYIPIDGFLHLSSTVTVQISSGKYVVDSVFKCELFDRDWQLLFSVVDMHEPHNAKDAIDMLKTLIEMDSL